MNIQSLDYGRNFSADFLPNLGNFDAGRRPASPTGGWFWYLEQVNDVWVALIAHNDGLDFSVTAVTPCGKAAKFSLPGYDRPRYQDGSLATLFRAAQVFDHNLIFTAFYNTELDLVPVFNSVNFDTVTGHSFEMPFTYDSKKMALYPAHGSDKCQEHVIKEPLVAFTANFTGNTCNIVLFNQNKMNFLAVSDRTITKTIEIPGMTNLTLPRFSSDGLTVACIGSNHKLENFLITIDLDFFHN